MNISSKYFCSLIIGHFSINSVKSRHPNDCIILSVDFIFSIKKLNNFSYNLYFLFSSNKYSLDIKYLFVFLSENTEVYLLIFNLVH